LPARFFVCFVLFVVKTRLTKAEVMTMTTLLAVLLALTHWSVASVVQAAGAALA
jgi:hypothetical protein